MSDMKKKERDRQTRTERELEALGEGSSGNKPAAAAPAAPKAAPKEKVGTGRDDSQANFDRLAAGLRQRISVAKKAGNATLAAKLEARLAELRKTVQ